MFGSLNKQNQKRPMKFAASATIYVVAGAAIAIYVPVIWTILNKSATFAASSQNNSHLMLLGFLGVITVLVIAAPVGFLELQRTEEKEPFPAAEDPLTELENRRELFDTLDTEIKRSNRTQRPFAFLRIQIADLERINSEYGQWVGESALRRLAQVLQAHCRELDTVVRYGRDEFALVFPEASPGTARQVTRRIRERFVGGRELPPISIRIGSAMFGEDGESIGALLEAADRKLYNVENIACPQTSLCA